MGEHKTSGKIKGNGYRDNQNMKGHKVAVYSPSNYRQGQVFKMRDGRKYQVQPTGAFRRVV